MTRLIICCLLCFSSREKYTKHVYVARWRCMMDRTACCSAVISLSPCHPFHHNNTISLSPWQHSILFTMTRTDNLVTMTSSSTHPCHHDNVISISLSQHDILVTTTPLLPRHPHQPDNYPCAHDNKTFHHDNTLVTMTLPSGWGCTDCQ